MENDIKYLIESIKGLSISHCYGEFHIFPFVITYLYANEKIELVKTESLDDISSCIILYKDLSEAFCSNTFTLEEQDDYNNNIDYYALTAQLKENNRTDVIVKLALEMTTDIMQQKGILEGISNAMFKLYNLLSAYSPCLIKKELYSIFIQVIDYTFFFTTPVQDYYKMRNLKNCKELSKLMIGLLTINNNNAYSIAHPMAGPANFMEYVNNNVTYQATMQDLRFLCLFQLLSDVAEKKSELLPYEDDDILNLQAEYVVFDNISVRHEVWENIACIARNRKQGVFYTENDALFEFNNPNLCKGVDGIDLLKNHISHIIFLPEGKSLICVCKEKKTTNVILVDESHSNYISAQNIINDVVCLNNSFVLTQEEYISSDFVLEQNRILGKIARIKHHEGKSDVVLLKDILIPSDEVGLKLCEWELKTFDYNYSRFHPCYIVQDGKVINITEFEAKETCHKRVLLLDLYTKQRFQPKILYYDNLQYSLSIDDSAYYVKEGIVELNYLINEMNKEYFIKQIFPTDVKVDAALEWKDLGQCYIKLPDMYNTATPLERQKLLLNEEKMEFINKLLRSYDYDVMQVINGDKADLEKNTILYDGRYRIVKCLGSGGFGKTYKAIRVNADNSETIVAIKEFFDKINQKRAENSNAVVNLSSDIKSIVEVRNKFFTEAKKIKRFADCENIIKVYDVFDENNTSYYSMEYIDGDNLHEYVEKKGRLSENEAIRIIRGVANALKEMHNEKMLHMDVKPLNIMVCKNGRVVLIDFGGAHRYNTYRQENSTLVNLNSPGFTPPERVGNYRFSPSYDIYSLGATLLFMLSGCVSGNESEESRVVQNIYDVTLQNDVPSDVSIKTKECIEQSMNFQAHFRPQTIDEFLAMLPSE